MVKNYQAEKKLMKSAVITGGSRGIGRACAIELAKAGYAVVINYVNNESAAKETQRLIEADGGTAVLFRADVSEPDQARKLISKCLMEFGGIDVLVNNAGVGSPTLFLQTEPEELMRVTGVNYFGTFYTSKAAAKEMLSSGNGGSIINISSMWGVVGGSGEAAYSASKAAVIGLTKALAKELAPSKIRVNCIAPGVIDTDMNACYSGEVMEELKEKTPLGRIGAQQDVATIVRFLASDDASFITGQVIAADGGFSL